MAGERWTLIGGIWRRPGWPTVDPGDRPTNPTLPPPPPSTPRFRVTELSVTGSGTTGGGGGGTGGGGTPAGVTLFGACPSNPGGAALADEQRVVTKFGGHPSIRAFASDFAAPHHPTAASRVHTSYKAGSYTDAQIASGAADSAIAALVAATPNGDVIELKHESDNDGLTGTAVTTRIQAKNRLYTIKQATKPGVLVAHTHTGGMWASYGSDTTRDKWMLTAKGDLIGVDLDGLHTTTGPDYRTPYDDEVANVLRYLAKASIRANGFIGWTVPEYGTSRQPWDTTGQPRADWFAKWVPYISGGTLPAYMCCLFDYDTSAHNTATNYNSVKPGTPEFTLWQQLIASNPAT